MERTGRNRRDPTAVRVGRPFTTTLGVMFTAATQHRYVSEAIWLPTYLSIAALILGSVESTNLAMVSVAAALLGCRLFLELVYRFVLGDARLQWHIGLVALASQVAIWGTFWFMYSQRGTA